MKFLVATATYNEAENIVLLLNEIIHYAPQAHILIVDDGSPDGTGKLVEEFAATHPATTVILLQRGKKLGLGTAHVLMMQTTLARDYDVLITMDADFSHHPKYLPQMMQLMERNDFVIGSRYMEGGGSDYGFLRQCLSRTANFLARFLLGIQLHECTTSYRGFKRSRLAQLNLDTVRSTGYSFFFEMVYHIQNLGARMQEFPIHFPDRVRGKSKINRQEMYKALLMLGKLTWLRWRQQALALVKR